MNPGISGRFFQEANRGPSSGPARVIIPYQKGPEDSEGSLSFGIRELAGSVGNFGTILPLSLALAATGDLSISPILFFLRIWCHYGILLPLPGPIEPMKVIPVIAVAESLSGGVIAASGLVLGIVFLLLAFTDWLDIIQKYIPEAMTTAPLRDEGSLPYHLAGTIGSGVIQ